MDFDQILGATISAALVVLSGALYALLFALGRLRGSAGMLRAAFGAYSVLCVCVLALSHALGLGSGWLSVVVTMLLGYLLAPIAIWHLCVGTHAETRSPPTRGDQRSNR